MGKSGQSLSFVGGGGLPREELADLNKKLLKRPTSLEDNGHQSLTNDYQPGAEKPRTFLVVPVVAGFLDALASLAFKLSLSE